MITEITAKTLLHSSSHPDPWFGLKYGLNLYRGCQHHCIYCDSLSACYQIDDFDRDVLVKVNAPDLLERELAHKRVKGTIGTGSMNDPYMPIEAEYQLTRRVLGVIAGRRFPVHIITKSSLVARDLDLLQQISQVYAAVSFTLTTPADDLARLIEPGAPLPSERLVAMRTLADAGILTGVTLMPLLPFLEDQPDQVMRILELAAAHGAKYVIPAFGVTLRDRQRAYFYDRLDAFFPGKSDLYRARYGERYSCDVPGAGRLYRLFEDVCRRLNLLTHMPFFTPPARPVQGALGL